MMKGLLLLLVVQCCSAAILFQDHVPEDFVQFMERFNKTYANSAEMQKRIGIFEQAKIKIAQLNEDAAASGFKTKFGITKFSDLTEEEFSSKYFGYKSSGAELPNEPSFGNVNLPVSMDWRKKGAVTPVKNQEQCGSCWAFSAVEGVESAWFLKKNQLLQLSPQQVVSCDDGDNGCDGGDLPTAFAYIAESGLETNKVYPYTSGDGNTGTCKYHARDVVAHISGFKYATTTGNETAMQAAMMINGPLSICVDASTWQYYTSGIITHGCGDSLDHCVQIVGWDVDSTSNPPIPYWIIRNSWGTDWGLDGYLWVERNKDECGVSDEATWVTI